MRKRTDFRQWLEHRRAQMPPEENEWTEAFSLMTVATLAKVDSRRWRARRWMRRKIRRLRFRLFLRRRGRIA